ncbi:hypothetical protein VCUG_00812 [Vavraia culicis subsp. floridensis]|uniref:Uncharacterized protein n=1 Tax=Vavraia culicis (isolate floridensis) TaxID=948595 RepID=L2GX96_VAVCU|nr:uncharacterized protein VCUG_00812 [Vavraia culicis subsp. floridensis]ELA47730.1 hypothetical protein VCUG_00812 [Vavraia culicis subsp. floridensis]
MYCFAYIPLFCLCVLSFPTLRPQKWFQPLRATAKAAQKFTPLNVQVPDLKPLLDVIVKGCETLDTNLAAIVTQTEDETSKIIADTITKEIKEIEGVVDGSNTLCVSQLTNLFQTTTKTISDLIQAITGSEETDTSKLLKEKETTLVKTIQDLINGTNNKIKDLVDAHTNEEFIGLESLIKSENQTIYTQIKDILADPQNTNPIIPQLKFPDPVTIADSIVPGKNQLHDNLVKIVSDLLEQIKSEIQKVEQYELTNQQSIIGTGTASYTEQLNTIRHNTLVSVQKITDDVSSSEITTILNVLAANNLEMKNDIISLTQKMDQDASGYIIEITTLEIDSLTPLIAEYNRTIAGQIIPNLKPQR